MSTVEVPVARVRVGEETTARFKQCDGLFSIERASVGYRVHDRVDGLTGGPSYWRPTLRGANRKLALIVGVAVLQRQRPLLTLEQAP